MKFTRYAIYYAPDQDTDWVEFATSWLGWDMQTGQKVKQPHLPDLGLPLADIIQVPRRYGLHATLKPPFRLAFGFDKNALENALAGLSQSLCPVSLGPLRLTQLGRFLALCPPSSTPLSALATACVTELDHLRASPTQQEIERRSKAKLSTRQQSNLLKWGYPHVLDDFRFHITLTGRLQKPDLETVQIALDRLLAPLLPQQETISSLVLAGEDQQGYFHLIRRFALSAVRVG